MSTCKQNTKRWSVKKVNHIIAAVAVVGSLMFYGNAMAVEQSECASAAMILRGGATVEMTVGNETFLAKGIAVPIGCWIQVEIQKGPNAGRKYWLNLMQVSKFADQRP